MKMPPSGEDRKLVYSSQRSTCLSVALAAIEPPSLHGLDRATIGSRPGAVTTPSCTIVNWAVGSSGSTTLFTCPMRPTLKYMM